jgi:hypothetical protein
MAENHMAVEYRRQKKRRLPEGKAAFCYDRDM